MSDRIAELEGMLKDSNQRVSDSNQRVSDSNQRVSDSNQRVSEFQERLVTLRAATTRTLMLIHRIDRSYPRARFFKRGETNELQFCCVSQ